MSKAKDIAQRLQGGGDSYARELQGQIDSLSDRAERTEEALNAEDPQRYEKLRKGAMGILQAVGKYADAVGKEEATVAGYNYEFERNKMISDISKMTALEKSKAMAEGGLLQKFHTKWEGKFDALGDNYKNQFLINLHSDISKIGIDTEKSRIKQGLEMFQAGKMQILQAEWAKGATTGEWIGAKEFAAKLSRLAASEFPGNDKAIKAARKAAMQGAAGEFLDGKLRSHVKAQDIAATEHLLRTKGAEGIFEKSTIDLATSFLTRSKTTEFKTQAITKAGTMFKNGVALHKINDFLDRRGMTDISEHLGRAAKDGKPLPTGIMSIYNRGKYPGEVVSEIHSVFNAYNERLTADPASVAAESGQAAIGSSEMQDLTGSAFPTAIRKQTALDIAEGRASIENILQAFPTVEKEKLKVEMANALTGAKKTKFMIEAHRNMLRPEEYQKLRNLEMPESLVNTGFTSGVISKISQSIGADQADAIAHITLAKALLKTNQDIEASGEDVDSDDKKEKIRSNYEELLEAAEGDLLTKLGGVKRQFGVFDVAVGGGSFYAENAYIKNEKNLEIIKSNISALQNTEKLAANYPWSNETRDKILKGWKPRLVPEGETLRPYFESPEGVLFKPSFNIPGIGDIGVMANKHKAYNIKGNIFDIDGTVEKRDGKFSKLAYNRLSPQIKQDIDNFVATKIPDALAKTKAPKAMRDVGALILSGFGNTKDIATNLNQIAVLTQGLDAKAINNNPLFKRKHLIMMALSGKDASFWTEDKIKKLTMQENPFDNEKDYKRVINRMLPTGTLSDKEKNHLRLLPQSIWEQPEFDPLAKRMGDDRARAVSLGIDMGSVYDWLMK